LKELEKTIREKTQGQIAFRVYAAAFAGDELDALRKIRIGQLQSAAFSGWVLDKFFSGEGARLPFLFRNYKK